MRPMFILVNDLSNRTEPDYIWYVCALKYHTNPKSSWVLSSTQTLKKNKAIQFCRAKASLIADILSEQIDEEDFSCKWVIEKI